MDNHLRLDPAEIIVTRLRALTALLAVEEVAAAFAQLDVTNQTALFGLFESIAADIGVAIEQEAEVCHA